MKFIISIIFLILILTKTTTASGFGVSPSELDFVIEKNTEVSRQINIYNTGEETEFKAMSSNPDILSVYPNKGIIPKDGSTYIKITAKGTEPGHSEEKITISVGNYDESIGKITMALGTTVSVKILVFKSAPVQASMFLGSTLSASIVITGLSGYLARRKLKP
jgi:hypothetical protein